MNHYSTIIIGGGIAGLTCAKYLNDSGLSFILIEASDKIGGRIRTEYSDGFCLDYGLQLFSTNYPEARRLLDYEALELHSFDADAKIRLGNKFHKINNPYRNKFPSLQSFFSSLGSSTDHSKFRKLMHELAEISDEKLFENEATDALTFLKNYGFSQQMIDNFFTPIVGEFSLENNLSTSNNFLKFSLKHFLKAEIALPAKGIQAIPEQIEQLLPLGTILKNTKVKSIAEQCVYLENGEILKADNIVIATDAENADVLLNESHVRVSHPVICMYFAAEYSPLKGQKSLIFNADRRSPVHTLCVPSDIAPAYAPVGKALISVNTYGVEKIDEKQMLFRIKRDLGQWFGAQVNVWKHLKTYQIPNAVQTDSSDFKQKPLKLGKNLYRCGDYLAYPSLNGAMQTGREVAQAISALWEE